MLSFLMKTYRIQKLVSRCQKVTIRSNIRLYFKVIVNVKSLSEAVDKTQKH